MFLKSLINVVLGSMVMSGLLQASFITRQAIEQTSAQNISKIKLKDSFEPFNPSDCVHSATGDGSYYAYYRGSNVFPHEAPFLLAYQFGYILKLSRGQSYQLTTAYNCGKQQGINALGAMIGYVTNGPSYRTIYSGTWDLANDFYSNAWSGEISIITDVFINISGVDDWINSTIAKGQSIDFFFYSEVDQPRFRYYAKVLLRPEGGTTQSELNFTFKNKTR